MAINEPVWSYGESKVFSSSGETPESDSSWSYGENDLLHEYEAAGGLSMAVAMHHIKLMRG